MSLSTTFMLTIKCPDCGKIHQFSVNGIVEKGTIYCSCGKTIVVDNANQFIKKIDELERPSPQVALKTKPEKKEEKVEEPKVEEPKVEEPKVEKPKEEKKKAEKPKTKKTKSTKAKEEKSKKEKPKEKKTRKKKSKKEAEK